MRVSISDSRRTASWKKKIRDWVWLRLFVMASHCSIPHDNDRRHLDWLVNSPACTQKYAMTQFVFLSDTVAYLASVGVGCLVAGVGINVAVAVGVAVGTGVAVGVAVGVGIAVGEIGSTSTISTVAPIFAQL